MHDEDNDGRFPRWCQAHCRSRASPRSAHLRLARGRPVVGSPSDCQAPGMPDEHPHGPRMMIPPVSTRSRTRTATVELPAPLPSAATRLPVARNPYGLAYVPPSGIPDLLGSLAERTEDTPRGYQEYSPDSGPFTGHG